MRDCVTSCTVTGVLKRRQYLSSAVSRISLTGKRFIASFLKLPTSSSILQPASDLTLWMCAPARPGVICFTHTVTYTLTCSHYGIRSISWLKLSVASRRPGKTLNGVVVRASLQLALFAISTPEPGRNRQHVICCHTPQEGCCSGAQGYPQLSDIQTVSEFRCKCWEPLKGQPSFQIA